MAKFQLRYQAIEIKLKKGEFFVGRESTSNLVLNDLHVSRRHAVFRVVGSIVEVEDLDSRNGVYVNETRIERSTRLKHGDRIDIGSHELLLKDVSAPEQVAEAKDPRTVSERTVEFVGTCVNCGVPLAYGLKECSNCGEPFPVSAAPNSDNTFSKEASASKPFETSPASLVVLLTNIAGKALNMGRHDEADRILTGVLNDILERAKKERMLSPDESGKAAEYAFLLLETTFKTHWLDYLFQLHEATRQLMSAEVVEGVFRIVNKLRYDNPDTIRKYLKELKSTAHAFNPTERFQYNRLQGLEQLISSRKHR